jgi:uncharacterized protein YbjT (DUF2867 family)
MSDTVTLSVFGATGATGQVLVQAALKRGHQVRALCRPGSLLAEGAPGLVVLRGQLDSPRDIASALAGAAAACVVFGPRPGQPQPFCADATQRIVEEMRRIGLERLVCQTGAMIGGRQWDANRSWAMRLMAAMFRRGDPVTAADRQRQEEIVQASGLAWTLVKPPRLTDAPAAPLKAAGPGVRVGMGSSVSRGTLAGLILDEIETPRFVRQAVFVAG